LHENNPKRIKKDKNLAVWDIPKRLKIWYNKDAKNQNTTKGIVA
jgi:hypothetical protein